MKHRLSPILVILGVLFLALFVLANTPPVARFEVRAAADGSQTTILFDASASSDPDGAIAIYQWIYGDGYSGSGVTKTHTFSSISTYTVTLNVFDNGGAWSQTSRTIDLTQPIAPQAPLGEAAAPNTPAPNVVIPYDVPIGILAGERAPAFALPNQAGEIVELADFLGHVVLIEFWSSSCSGCQASMPHLEALREEFADRGLVVITITINRNVEGEWEYLSRNGFTQFVALREVDPIGRPTKVMYDVSAIPHAYLLDRQGVIYYTGHINYVRSDMIESLF